MPIRKRLLSDRRRTSPAVRRPRRSSGEWLLEAHTQEDLARCVVMLAQEFTETEKVDGEQFEIWLRAPGARRATPKVARHLGTGFLVAMGDETLIVTARHVARRMGTQARVFFVGRRGAARSRPLGRLLERHGTAIAWAHHRTADVSVARVTRPPTELRQRFLPATTLPTRTAVPSGAADLLVVGFPLGLMSRRHFTPIAKRMHVASGVLRFCGDEMTRPAAFFLLDQPTMGGYSGAPVFTAPGPQAMDAAVVLPRCVGLISQTISDEGGAQFAAVVPSTAIRSLLSAARRPPRLQPVRRRRPAPAAPPAGEPGPGKAIVPAIRRR